jgi:hypothetical protein
MFLRVPACALALALPITAARPAFPAPGDDGKPRPIAVGDIAPPIGPVPWLQIEASFGRKPPAIEALRGKVVVVTTFGTYCDSCIRVGIPLANAIRRANAAEDLCVVSVAAQIAADTNDSTLRDAKKLGIEHSFALGGAMGGSSPYLDMSVNGNLTYAFVIGRCGGIAWKGDPSRDPEEYLQAVTRALTGAPAEPLPPTIRPELAGATKSYVLGELEAAEKDARKIHAQVEKRPDADAAAVKTGAQALLACIDATRTKLLDQLTAAAEAKDAERFERARSGLAAAFPRGDTAKRCAELVKTARADAGFASTCDAWAAWLELERTRPASFPASAAYGGAKYAQLVARYLEKSKDGPGAAGARAWLATFEALPKR